MCGRAAWGCGKKRQRLSKQTASKSQIGRRKQEERRGRTLTKEQGCWSEARVTGTGAGKRKHWAWEGQFVLEKNNLVIRWRTEDRKNFKCFQMGKYWENSQKTWDRFFLVKGIEPRCFGPRHDLKRGLEARNWDWLIRSRMKSQNWEDTWLKYKYIEGKREGNWVGDKIGIGVVAPVYTFPKAMWTSGDPIAAKPEKPTAKVPSSSRDAPS